MIISRAPLRMTLGGGGTDLPSYYERFGGFFLACALNKYIFICLNSSAVDQSVKLKYSEAETELNVEVIRHPFFREALLKYGIRKGIELASLSDIPSGTGMGSSGSFIVALLAALRRFKDLPIDKQEIAEEAFEIEVLKLGFPVGKQDPYIAAYGGITAFEIEKNGEVKAKTLQVSDSFIQAFYNQTLLFYTGLRRRSREVLVHQKEATEKEDRSMLDNLHLVKELGYRIEKAIISEDLQALGTLMNKHWQNKRKRSVSITNSCIDGWYDLAIQNGALGGKLMGAGGGGFMIFVCPDENTRRKVSEAFRVTGLKEVDFRFDLNGIQIMNY